MFYGWKLALLGSFGNFMLQGSALYAMNAFMEPLTDLHGWSRTGINMAMGIASLCGTASMPFIALLASQYSLRYIITLAALFGGVAFILLGYVQSLWLFAFFFAVVWVTGQACGGVGANILMEHWFSRHTGRVFGLVNVGTSLSGAILPFTALVLVDTLGVTWAFTLLGSLIILFVPFCYVMIRDKPEDLGLLVNGEPLALSEEEANAEKPLLSMIQSISTHDLIRNPAVWIIGSTGGMVLMVTAGVISQLKPRFADVGFDSYAAMLWMSLAALCAAFGKYAWGVVCDRLTPLKALKLVLLCNALSLSLIFLPQNISTVLIFAILYGVCYGGVWAVLPTAIVYVFGRHNFLSAYRIISIFIIIKALGYPIIGLSYGYTGSYDMGYLFFIIQLLCAFLLSLLLKEESAFGYIPKKL